jgi:putative MATE family efflux protein
MLRGKTEEIETGGNRDRPRRKVTAQKGEGTTSRRTDLLHDTRTDRQLTADQRLEDSPDSAGTVMDAKYIQMTRSPLRRLILAMAVPAVIANIVSMVYNLTDTFFIGQLGTSASAAVGVVMPIQIFIQAVGLLFGMGSGNKLSIELGRKNMDRARRLVAVGFYLGLISGIVLGVLAFALREPLIRAFGATPTILPYAVSYATPLFFGAPFFCSTFALNAQLRFEGYSTRSMIGIVVGSLLNIGLEPLFIFGLHMGIFGGGLATAICQFVSWLILLIMHQRTGVAIRVRNFRLTADLWNEIFSGGVPSLIRNGMLSVSASAINIAANPFGDAAIAAMTIINRVITLFNTIQIGFGQGFQPVCGYNYGARKFDRVRKGYWFVVQISVTLLLVASIGMTVFAAPIVRLFRDDPEVVRIGAQAMFWNCLTFTLSGYVVPSNMMQQTIGHTVISSIVGLGRQGIFLVPALLIFPPHLGMLGVMISQPVADICTFVMTVPLQTWVMRQLEPDRKITMRRGIISRLFRRSKGERRSV